MILYREGNNSLILIPLTIFCLLNNNKTNLLYKIFKLYFEYSLNKVLKLTDVIINSISSISKANNSFDYLFGQEKPPLKSYNSFDAFFKGCK